MLWFFWVWHIDSCWWIQLHLFCIVANSCTRTCWFVTLAHPLLSPSPQHRSPLKKKKKKKTHVQKGDYPGSFSSTKSGVDSFELLPFHMQIHRPVDSPLGESSQIVLVGVWIKTLGKRYDFPDILFEKKTKYSSKTPKKTCLTLLSFIGGRASSVGSMPCRRP